jgi:hypothetical protein
MKHVGPLSSLLIKLIHVEQVLSFSYFCTLCVRKDLHISCGVRDITTLHIGRNSIIYFVGNAMDVTLAVGILKMKLLGSVTCTEYVLVNIIRLATFYTILSGNPFLTFKVTNRLKINRYTRGVNDCHFCIARIITAAVVVVAVVVG